MSPKEKPKVTYLVDDDKVGAYYRGKGIERTLKPDVYVPPFMSREFRLFLRRFVANPGDNPVFLREFRRSLRIHPIVERAWPVLLLTLASLSLAIGTLLAFLTNGPLDIPILRGETYAVMYFMALGWAASLFGLFSGIRDNSRRWNGAMLDEYAVTELNTQEVVFGEIVGSETPLLVGLSAIVPGWIILNYYFFYLHDKDPAGISPLSLIIAVLLLIPHLGSSLLAGSSIGSALSHHQETTETAILKPLVGWLICGILLNIVVLYPVLFTITQDGAVAHAFFILLAPSLILLRFAIAGGFLNHLAVIIARRQETGED